MNHSYLLAGISSGKFIKLLSRNGFSIHPKYLFRILFLIQGSVFATIFNRIEKMKKGKHLRQYTMPADPVFIIGHWRTGTTLLHQLMALDENLVTPTVFHVSTPESFLVSEKFYRPVMTKAMKSTRPMDNVKLGFDQPQEEEYALIKMTTDSPLERLIFPKSDNYFLSDIAHYKFKDEKKWKKSFEDFCLRLSFINGKRVLLKNPFHSLRIPLLLAIFPNAKFIHIHRHPYEVVPSTIHMWDVVGNENKLNNKPINANIRDVSVLYGRVLSEIKDQSINLSEESMVEIGFSELENDPITVIKEIYNRLDLSYSQEFELRVKHWIEEMKTYRKNKYELSVSEKDSIREILSEHFIYYNYKQ